MKRRICSWTWLENWKKLWNMKVTIIPIVIGAFGPVTKWLLKRFEDLEINERVETIQTTTLLRVVSVAQLAARQSHNQSIHYWERPEYWEESWRLEETCCLSNSSERTSAHTDVKYSHNNNDNNNNDNRCRRLIRSDKKKLKKMKIREMIRIVVLMKDRSTYRLIDPERTDEVKQFLRNSSK